MDLDEIWPAWIRQSDARLVVTLYDLIPLVMRTDYLTESSWGHMGTAWMARLGLIRSAHQVLTISQRTADDAMEHLGVSQERITVIDSGVSGHHSSLVGTRDEAEALLRRERPKIRRDFLLYVGGDDARKNMEGTIRALRAAAGGPAKEAPAGDRVPDRAAAALRAPHVRAISGDRKRRDRPHRLRHGGGARRALSRLRAFHLPIPVRGRGPPDPGGDVVRRPRRRERELLDPGAAWRSGGDLRPRGPRGHRPLPDARCSRTLLRWNPCGNARADGWPSTPGSGWRDAPSRGMSERCELPLGHLDRNGHRPRRSRKRLALVTPWASVSGCRGVQPTPG